MELSEYQSSARRTAYYDEHKTQTLPSMYVALGLAGEAGEVANLVKKQARDDADNVEAIREELGDVLWYVAQACSELGVSLDLLAVENLEKLEQRHG